MAKKKELFLCTSCGAEYSKWSGKCYSCNQWDVIVEIDNKTTPREKGEVIPIGEIAIKDLPRIDTKNSEFNLVCGGGIVPGSIILMGGEPGIGKSTMALQIARSMRTLYISGEESPAQIRMRAERLGIEKEKIFVSTCTSVEEIVELVIPGDEKQIQCMIIDSIQTVYSHDVPGMPGSISQIRESASRLARFAKKLNISIMLIGHINKEGSIAGPKLLEHIVDTVLYFEGDSAKEYRILRAFKNRFGSINEIGLFRMTGQGLEEVRDKNRIFLNSFSAKSPGNAVSAALEGSRTILFEVQSLVTFTNFSNPRRMADGLDLNRLILIIAVLEKHGGLKLGGSDVFINVSGGFSISETSADLAVAMAIASSLKEKSIPERVGILGELSLSGDVRPVTQCLRRVQEFRHSGFETIILPESDLKEAEKGGFQGNIIGVRNIHEALDKIF